MEKTIKTLLLAGIGVFLWSCNSSPDQKPESEITPVFTRVNANTSPSASTVLALYAYGMDVIKSLDCTNPSSWYYQGSMHHVPDLKDMGGTTDSLCAPHDTMNFRGWNTCPHMYPTNSQLNFLTWHRLYVYYYEKNLRYHIANGAPGFPGLGSEVANQFSLPYWDYTNQGLMPEAFRLNAWNTDFANWPQNPLYEHGRSPSLLAGESIDYQATDGIAVNVNGTVKNLCVRTMQEALNVQKFLSLYDVSEFSRGLEDRLHNVMHDYIGGAVNPQDTLQPIYNRIYQKSGVGMGLMAYIPSAGFDPIFFLHHSNVDRMFASWEAQYGPITVEDMLQYSGGWDSIQNIYQFWDAPTGNWVTYSSMQAMLDSVHAINYQFEQLASPYLMSDAKLKSARKSFKTALVQEAKLAQPRQLMDVAESFEIPLTNSKALKSQGPSDFNIELDISFDKNMLQRLLVFSIPEDFDWTACDLDPAYIHGVIGVFGSTHAMNDASGHHGHHDATFRHQVVLNVSETMKQKSADESLKIYVVPIGAAKRDAHFYVNSIRLFEKN